MRGLFSLFAFPFLYVISELLFILIYVCLPHSHRNKWYIISFLDIHIFCSFVWYSCILFCFCSFHQFRFIPFLSYMIYLLLLLPIFRIFSYFSYHSPPLPHFLSSSSFQSFIFLFVSKNTHRGGVYLKRKL